MNFDQRRLTCGSVAIPNAGFERRLAGLIFETCRSDTSKTRTVGVGSIMSFETDCAAMERRHPLTSELLLPVQIRVDGLHERLAHLDRALAEAPDDLSEDMRQRLECADLCRGLNGVLRSFEAIVTTLCLVLDGSVPDDEEGWYEGSLRQLAGCGSGRVPALPPDLVVLLRQLVADPDFDPILELEENLAVQRRRRQVAVRAAPMLIDSLGALDIRLADGTLRAGDAPDPEYVAHHAGRQERAKARERALKRTLSCIKAAFHDRGYRVILFGSLLERRVHGRSDLDLLVPGAVPREEQGALWTIVENITRAEGVPFDLHFPALYDPEFLDRLKVIRNGQILPLRALVGASVL